MRLYLLAFCFFSFEKAFSQIDILESKEKEYPKPASYDSTYNYGGFKSLLRLTGQIIYFIPKSKKYKSETNKNSNNFFTKKKIAFKNPRIYDREDSIFTDVYKPIYKEYNFLTPLDSIYGKSFIIKKVIKDQFGLAFDNATYLEIISKKDIGDSLIYKIDLDGLSRFSPNDEFDYNDLQGYLIQGYYQKLKNEYVNKKFYLTENIGAVWDIKNSKQIEVDTTNKEWICSSVSLVETESLPLLYLSLIFQNGDKSIAISRNRGFRVSIDEPWETISLSSFKSEKQIIEEKLKLEEIERRKKEAVLLQEQEEKKILLEKIQFESEMIKKYGARTGKLISDNKVVIGMSQEICKLSWGEPYDVNRTITKSKVFEQWVYSMGTYLYFENDILVAIQD